MSTQPKDADAIASETRRRSRVLEAVSKAAIAFESRWARLTLHRVDPALSQKLWRQSQLFDRAREDGNIDVLEKQAGGLVRGYAAAVAVMQASGEPDDAYLIGECPMTGLRIALGHSTAVFSLPDGDRPGMPWFSPDEIATLLATSTDPAIKFALQAKQVFAGAQVVTSLPPDAG